VDETEFGELIWDLQDNLIPIFHLQLLKLKLMPPLVLHLLYILAQDPVVPNHRRQLRPRFTNLVFKRALTIPQGQRKLDQLIALWVHVVQEKGELLEEGLVGHLKVSAKVLQEGIQLAEVEHLLDIGVLCLSLDGPYELTQV